jgi:hypothetical protein
MIIFIKNLSINLNLIPSQLFMFALSRSQQLKFDPKKRKRLQGDCFCTILDNREEPIDFGMFAMEVAGFGSGDFCVSTERKYIP